MEQVEAPNEAKAAQITLQVGSTVQKRDSKNTSSHKLQENVLQSTEHKESEHGGEGKIQHSIITACGALSSEYCSFYASQKGTHWKSENTSIRCSVFSDGEKS